MMGPGMIRQMSREAAVRAAAERLEPFIVEEEDLQDWRALVREGRLPTLPFPNLGDLVPAGWRMEDTLFCDSSGFGSPGEPALTAEELITRRLEAGKAYAIIETGQFQLYLGVFVRDPASDLARGQFCDACQEEVDAAEAEEAGVG